MCFYWLDDCEWIAAIDEESKCISNGSVRCCECGRAIPIGEEYVYLFQRESDGECVRCEYGDCECEDECCQCEEPDLGNTFEASTCR